MNDNYGEVVHWKENQFSLRIVEEDLAIFRDKSFIVDWLCDWRSDLTGKRGIRFNFVCLFEKKVFPLDAVCFGIENV